MAVRHDGESISRGQLDRRAADARALRDVLWFVAVFAGSVFINGILFMTVDQSRDDSDPRVTLTDRQSPWSRCVPIANDRPSRMACFGSLHEVVSDPADLPEAIRELEAIVLRGLAYEGELPA